jgi:type II secretory pathway component PulM
MINLLPPPILESALANYRRRRRVVAGWLVFLVLAAAAVLLVVFYFTLVSRRASTETAYEFYSNQAEVLEFRQLQAELRVAEARLALISEAAAYAVPATNSLARLLEHRGGDLSFSALAYNQVPPAEGFWQVSGEARTRQALLDFLTRVKADPTFESVESPVTNLIRETDAPFRLKLKVAVPPTQNNE